MARRGLWQLAIGESQIAILVQPQILPAFIDENQRRCLRLFSVHPTVRARVRLFSVHPTVRARVDVSVPAGLGKGQGAKETGKNLARERPKFGHSPARERNEVRAQFCGRSMKTWAQICKQKHFYSGCLKTQQQLHFVNGFFFFF